MLVPLWLTIAIGIACFITGALVFRNNASKGEQIVSAGKTAIADAGKVADAAKDVAKKL